VTRSTSFFGFDSGPGPIASVFTTLTFWCSELGSGAFESVSQCASKCFENKLIASHEQSLMILLCLLLPVDSIGLNVMIDFCSAMVSLRSLGKEWTNQSVGAMDVRRPLVTSPETDSLFLSREIPSLLLLLGSTLTDSLSGRSFTEGHRKSTHYVVNKCPGVISAGPKCRVGH
jgi:hypothetical protein